MTPAYEIREIHFGAEKWVAIRCRGADWSWFRACEAVALGNELLARAGSGQGQVDEIGPIVSGSMHGQPVGLTLVAGEP